MHACPHCGFPLEPQQLRTCPKCQEDAGRHVSAGLLVVDVAHAGESWEQASSKIMKALDQALFHRHKGLKIIHGYGANSGAAVIAPRAQSLMRHLADTHGGRFAMDKGNPGASLLWLNKAVKHPHEQNVTAARDSTNFAGNWFDQAIDQQQRWKKDNRG